MKRKSPLFFGRLTSAASLVSNAIRSVDTPRHCLFPAIACLLLAAGASVRADSLFLVQETASGKIGKYDSTTGSAINQNFITGLNTPHAMAFDSSLNIYVTGFTNNYVAKYASDGTLINSHYISSGLSNPTGIAVDASGKIFVVENGNNYVSKYNADGSVVNTTFINVATSPDGILISGSDMYVVRWASSAVGKYTTDGATTNASFLSYTGITWRPYNVARDSLGNFYVTGNDRVIKFASDGTLINSNLISFTGAYGLAIDSGDNLFVGAYGGSTIAKYTTNGAVINANFITGVNNVTGIVVQTVPEPATSALVILGGGGLAWFACSRRKSVK